MPDAPRTTGAVFLSYAREDAEAARRIADALRAFGVEVWFDLSELRGGDAWDAKIRRQIRECALFIPLVSANTQSRGEGYFRREWKQAVDRTHDMSEHRAFIVPVITDDTPEAAADVPEQFLKAQFTRLPGGTPSGQFVENVRRLLSTPQVQVPPARVVAPAVKSPVAVETAASGGPDPKSIAVLPLLNRSPDADQEYFVDGLSEELLNLLAKVPGLQVTSRSSAFSYKGTNARVAQVAHELNVANVLEGSVRKSGNRLRISVQLIDARKDRQLWSESYDRTIDDIFAVQDEIAGAVVEQLKVTLLGAAPKARTFDPKAFSLFLQARELERQLTPASLEEAIRLCREALDIDPTLAGAWVCIASCFINQADNGLRPIEEGYRIAGESANKALKIDPNHAMAYARLSQVSRADMESLAEGAAHMEKALRLDPTNVELIGEATMVARSLGRHDLGARMLEYCVAHDPVNPAAHSRLSGAYQRLGRILEAFESMRVAIRLNPGRMQSRMSIGEFYLMTGDPESALRETLQEPSPMWRLIGLAIVYHALGLKGESDSALAELIQTSTHEAAWNIAYCFAYRGETDSAFEWLEKALEFRDSGLGDTPWTWQFKPVMSDPRWLPFLRKIGRSPEQLAAIQFEVNLPER